MYDIDLVLKELGLFGRFQIAITVLVFSLWLVTAFHNSAPILINAVPSYRCFYPAIDTTRSKCYHGNDHENVSAHHLLFNDIEHYDGCRMYTTTPGISYDFNDTLTEAMFVKTGNYCQYGYVYDCIHDDTSIAIEWDLVCDKQFWRTFASMAYFAGLMIGPLFAGLAADRYGRRTVMLVASSGAFLGSLGCTFTPDFLLFCVFRFFVALCLQPLLTIGCVYLVELTAPKWHTFMGINMNTSYSFGVIVFAFLGYFIRPWRKLMLCFSAWHFLFPLIIYFLPESPRWLLVYNHIDKSRKSIEKIAKMNGRKITESFWTKVLKENEATKSTVAKYSVFNLFKSGQLRYITINMLFQWFTISMIYFGLTLNVSELAGNVYLNTSIVGIVNVIGCVTSMPLTQRLGCRRSLSLLSFIIGISCLLSMIGYIDNEILKYASTGCLMVGQLCVSGGYAVLYLYVPKIYPTDVRNTAIGLNSTVSMIGTLLSPLVLQSRMLFAWLPEIIFVVTAIFGSVLSLLLPETKDEKLLTTVDEAEAAYLVRRKSSRIFIRKESTKDVITVEDDRSLLNRSI